MTVLIKLHVLYWFSLFTAVTKALDPEWVYHQKAGALDTACLHDLMKDDTVHDTTFTTNDERTFLMDFFNKLNGPNWKNGTNWGDTDAHHCEWHGIECYPNNTYVKWIALSSNNLQGTLPNLWKFRNLQGMCLSRNNKMTGALSDIVSWNMTRLRRLSVSFTDIHGTIPWHQILQLQNLEKLQICCMVGKGLRGDLPHDIGKLYKLQVFSIGENSKIKGKLPRSIGNLTRLWFLDLEYAQLTGGSLHYFDNMTKLSSLHLTNCHLKSNIPTNFGINHPVLEDALLLGNQLEGELNGKSLLGLDNLEVLSLSRNNLIGLLPKELGMLPSLKILDLSRNDFRGFEKGIAFSNTSLEILYLNRNKRMNTDIKNLFNALQPCKNSLRILIASRCGFTGELKEGLWSLPLMTYVDLSENSLSGNFFGISVFAHMLYLFHLSLSSNNFNGTVDTVTFFTPMKALTYLNVTNNPLLRIPLQTYLQPNYDVEYSSPNHGYICPSVQITFTHGIVDMDPSSYDYSLCFCKPGYYGYGNHCLPCMDGGVCKTDSPLSRNGGPLNQTNGTSEVKMTMGEGYWPYSGGSNNVQRLIKCPQDGLLEDKACNPSGKCECFVKNVTTTQHVKTVCNSSCICKHGSSDRFCSKCIKGFYKRGDTCVICPEFRENFPVVITVCFVVCLIASVLLFFYFRSHKRLCLFVMFFLVVALIILHFSSIIPAWFFIIMTGVWIVGLYTEAQNIQSFICIAIFYFQSLDAMLSEAEIWPKPIVIFKYKVTNIFNFEFAQLICSFSSATKPEVLLLVVLLLPLTALFLVWFVYLVSKLCCRCVSSSMCKQVTIQILLLVYFPVTAKSLSALSPCSHIDGLSYLTDAPWLGCDGASSKWLNILGYVSLVLFVIAVPVFVFAPLLSKGLDAEGNPVTEDTAIWLRPLYEEFKPAQRKWFPLIFLSRRLLLAIMLSLVPATSCYQIIGITFLLVFFMILVLMKKPYREYSETFEFENMADVVISVVLLVSFVGLAAIRKSSYIEYSLVWLILCLNFVIVFFCILGIFALFTINLSRKPDGNGVQYEPIPG